jgi:ketosteroid isomerase-like protein
LTDAVDAAALETSMRGRVVRIAGAVLIVGAVVWIGSGLFESDEDRIERLVDEVRTAAEARDADAVMSAVADDVEWQGEDREALSRQVRRVLEEWPPDAIVAEVKDLVIDGDRATGSVDVLYRTKKFPHPYLTKFRVTFGRHDERWLVTGVDVR